MDALLVADIFGQTEALETLAKEISPCTEIFSPYGPTQLNLRNEQEAYRYFSERVGLESYTQKLSRHIRSLSGSIKLIGFSVGSAAIWKLSNDKSLSSINDAICFYGSQIRHSPSITPRFPIELIFPEEEKHFDLQKLIKELQNKPNVAIRQLAAKHGFMNLHSDGFNQNIYREMLLKLKGFAEKN